MCHLTRVLLFPSPIHCIADLLFLSVLFVDQGTILNHILFLSVLFVSLDQLLFLVTIFRLEYLVAIFSLQNRELYLVTDLIHKKKDANNAFLVQ